MMDTSKCMMSLPGHLPNRIPVETYAGKAEFQVPVMVHAIDALPAGATRVEILLSGGEVLELWNHNYAVISQLLGEVGSAVFYVPRCGYLVTARSENGISNVFNMSKDPIEIDASCLNQDGVPQIIHVK